MKFPSWQEMINQQQADRDSRNLMVAAKEGMSPFRARDIEVYEEFAIDYNKYRIVVAWYLVGGAEYLPCTIWLERDEWLDNPLDMMLKVANEVLQYYRFEIETIPMYIEGVPTHPHILLGEN